MDEFEQRRRYKSGAQKRRERAEREGPGDDVAGDAGELGDDEPGESPLAALFKKLGPPPCDPIGNTEWGHNAAATLAYVVGTARLTPLLVAQVKLIKDLIAVVGMTHAKAGVEAEIRRIKRHLGLEKAPDDGLDDLPPGRRAAPAGGSDRGDEPLPGSVSCPD